MLLGISEMPSAQGLITHLNGYLHGCHFTRIGHFSSHLFGQRESRLACIVLYSFSQAQRLRFNKPLDYDRLGKKKRLLALIFIPEMNYRICYVSVSYHSSHSPLIPNVQFMPVWDYGTVQGITLP